MARPTKQGVDYFPFDVHLDDKFKFIEIKYKLEGFAVAVKLLQRIYSQGYWCKWTEDEALLFSDEIRADFNLVQNVVSECIKRDVFNKRLFDDYEILTSKGIQKRYKEIIRRRKSVEVITDYLLIDNDFGVNDDIKKVNDDIKPETSEHDAGKSTQTKVNKTKVNKTKQILTNFSQSDMDNAKLLIYLMQENNPDVKQPDLDKWADDFRLIRERDNKTDEQVKYLIRWTQQNDFWSSNILSPSKLRKQWDQLVVKVAKDHQNQKQWQVANQGVDQRRLEEMLGDD